MTGIGARRSKASTAVGAIESSLAALLFLLLSIPAAAQPRRPEVFGFSGAARLSEDEGSLGNGPVFGGAVTLPFARRWAVDLDLMHFRSAREESGFRFGGNRTLFVPALQFRGGGQRSYGFAAFGAGVAASGTWSEHGGSRVHDRDTGLTLHTRAGFVAAITGRWLLRADIFLAFRYVAPDFGVRAGVGYRF